MEQSKSKKPKDILTSEKSRYVFIVVGLAAIILIFFSGQFSGGSQNAMPAELNSVDYEERLTAEVLSMVQSVEGAGTAKILITLEDSYEYIYLDDGKTLQKINEPTIRGVVVACQGGDSAVTREKISELLTTVLNIPSTKVCITKLT
ncbi:MAG: hypothetical protein IJC86_03150 [Clostridia bacterium]|nr:hypothetical protein [Clostridia bacterium]